MPSPFYINRFAFITLIGVLSISCNDIIEEDVSGVIIHLLTPADSLQTSALTHEFLWEDVPEAYAFRFQLADPDFQNPLSFVVDSIVTSHSISLTLAPSNYQWRVRAENSGSQSAYATRSLFLDSAETLFGQTVLLDSPSHGWISNNEEVEFSWNGLDNVSLYVLEILDSEIGDVLYTGSTQDLTLTYTLDEGSFLWRVYAINSIPSISDYEERGFVIDVTAPSIPTLVSPANNLSVFQGSEIQFQWNSGVDNLTTITDSLFIYSDAALSVLEESHEGTNETYSVLASELGSGTYYWVVRTFDAAGNLSQSTSRLFTIN